MMILRIVPNPALHRAVGLTLIAMLAAAPAFAYGQGRSQVPVPSRAAEPGPKQAADPAPAIADLQRTLDELRNKLADLRKAIDQAPLSSPGRSQLIPSNRTPVPAPGERIWEALIAGRLELQLLPDSMQPDERAEIGEASQIVFRYVPGGSFAMGASDEERKRVKSSGDPSTSVDWSVPEHRVHLSSGFFIAAAEITRGQYLAFVLDRSPEIGFSEFPAALKPVLKEGSHKTQRYNRRALKEPVVNLSWFEALAFCDWLSRRLPEPLRASLPTEVEWEYAARGPRSELSPWVEPDRFVLSDEHREIHAAASTPLDQSWCGVYDLGGNVQEWCIDNFDEDRLKDQARRAATAGANGAFEYVRPDLSAALRPQPSTRKVVRGGSAHESVYQSRAYNRRYKIASSTEYANIGFRPVLLITAPISADGSEPRLPSPGPRRRTPEESRP